MKGLSCRPQTGLIVGLWLCLGVSTGAIAKPELIGTYYRADESFPQFARFWTDSWLASEDWGESLAQTTARAAGLGASVHLFFRNTGPGALAIEDVRLQGVSLARAIAFSDQRVKRKPASIFFGDLPDADRQTLIEAGEPIWWRVDPPTVAPGELGEVTVRLRNVPRNGKLRLDIQAGQDTSSAVVSVQQGLPRIEGVRFAPDLRTVFMYLKDPKAAGAKPARILLDGQEMNQRIRVGADPQIDVTAVVLALKEPLREASLHCFEAVFGDERAAWAGVRAFTGEIGYGVWGGRSGKKSDTAAARAAVRELHDLNINLQMPQLGSDALAALYKSPEGQQYCASLGLRFVIGDLDKWGVEKPYGYFIHDEPDAGDAKITGLPAGHEVGSLAQWALQRSRQWRSEAPAVPQMLNVDLTYKPINWYVYGQLPDILMADPYYDPRLRTAYWNRPQQLPLYTRSTFVYAISRIVRSAAAPKPTHIILYANRYIDEKNDRQFRYPTPEGKRIEVYYALAAGAQGISYWWYSPGKPAYGLGGVGPEAERLRREIGLIGAEVRTAGPVILRSCPAQVKTKAPAAALVRCLLAGLDTMMLIVVNEQYANDQQGTVVVPLEGVEVSVVLPSWLRASDAFEVRCDGIAQLPMQANGSEVSLKLGTVDLTRMIVLTADAKLRPDLESLYRGQFAGNTGKLLKRGSEK